MPAVTNSLPSSSLHLTICHAVLLFLTIGSNFVWIPIHANLIITSTLIVYLGCHRSLSGSENGGETAKPMEVMKRKDAMMFPIFAGVTLCGLYVLFKFLDPATVNLIITGYMSLISVFICTNEFQPVLGMFFFPSKEFVLEVKIYFPYMFYLFGEGGDGEFKPNLQVQITKDNRLHIQLPSSGVFSFLSGIVVTVWYVKTKHFIANNLLGIAMSLQALESLSLGSYKTGVILLCLLFFYDIFFVFGTDVMVTVAKSVDAPIKLLFIKSFATTDSDAQFSMLGLGDIVLPGVFVAMLLRFDAKRANLELGMLDHTRTIFRKTFFNFAIVSYAMGLCCTVVVMYLFKHAQPALLYLVPAVVLASLFASVAVVGNFNELLNYSEEKKEDDGKTKAKADTYSAMLTKLFDRPME